MKFNNIFKIINKIVSIKVCTKISSSSRSIPKNKIIHFKEINSYFRNYKKINLRSKILKMTMII